MHHKLIVFGLILVAAVVFGSLFWSDLQTNKQEISETQLDTQADPNPAIQQEKQENSSSNEADDIEKELDETDLNVDSDNAELQAEASGL